MTTQEFLPGRVGYLFRVVAVVFRSERLHVGLCHVYVKSSGNSVDDGDAKSINSSGDSARKRSVTTVKESRVVEELCNGGQNTKSTTESTADRIVAVEPNKQRQMTVEH